MKRTAKRPAKCPICGTTYKVPSMAARCMRTPACRFYNAPGGERREAFRHQLCVGEVVAYTCDPLKKADVPQVREGAELALSGIDRLVPALHSLAINTRVFHLMDADMGDLLTTIWPLHVKTDVVHVVAIASNLVCDLKTVQGEWLAAHPDHASIWADIERGLDAIYDAFDPDGSEEYRHVDAVQPIYERLRAHIFGPEKQDEKLRAYLSGERFWVAARSKVEAREIVRREYGLVMPCKGMPQGLKLEDGRTVADLLTLAGGVPGIIAREGE